MKKKISALLALCTLCGAFSAVSSAARPTACPTVPARPTASARPTAVGLKGDNISVRAKSAILLEGSGGEVLFEKNSRQRLPMASTTKIMTALVAIENSPLDRKITVTAQSCGIEGSSVYLREGEVFNMEELLYALLLSSANDAATAIAIEIGGDIPTFAEMMNEKAEKLGLCDTHFTNPHGLDDEEHYTSAYDLARLASYALGVPAFREIVSTYRKTIGEGDSTRSLMNHNRLLKMYDDVMGVKTGYTKTSGRCLVSAAERNGVMLVCVTLSDPDDWNDHTLMLDYGFANYVCVNVSEDEDVNVKLPCVGGTQSMINCKCVGELSCVLPKNHGEITSQIDAKRMLFAPVNEGEVVGNVRYSCDGRELGSLELVSSDSSEYIEKKGFFKRILDLYK